MRILVLNELFGIFIILSIHHQLPYYYCLESSLSAYISPLIPAFSFRLFRVAILFPRTENIERNKSAGVSITLLFLFFPGAACIIRQYLPKTLYYFYNDYQ